MKALSLFISLLLAGVSYGQDAFIDSCKKVLNTDIEDTTRAKVYIDLAEYIADEDVWMNYNKRALNLATTKLRTAKGKSRLLYLSVKANAVGNLGYYFDDHGDKKKSLKNYFESLRLYEMAGNESGKSSILSNIGVIFTNQGDYKEALDYLEKSLKIKKKYNPEDLSKNYLNLGVVCENSGKKEEAIDYYKKALAAAQEAHDDVDIGTSYNNIGSFYYQNKNFKEAIIYLEKAINYFSLGSDDSGLAWALGNLGNSYYNLNEIDSAFYFISQAKEISDRLGYPELIQSTAEKLTQIYMYKEDWENALKHYQIAIKMRDSLNNIGVQKEALRQKLDFDHNLEKATLAAKRDEEKKRDQLRLVFSLLAMLMAVVFGVIIYSRLRITRKQKVTIEQQKREVESQKGLVEEKNKEIVDSINYAKRLQEAILPDRLKITEPFEDAFLLYLPKDIVAGDFFWMRKLNDNEILIAAADCTGHGVPGAMVSVVCANALDQSTKEFELSSTAEILDKVTELVVQRLDQGFEDVKDGMDIALCKVNLKSKTVEFSGANNPLWIVKKGREEVEVIKGDRQPVGKFENLKPFTSNTIQLNSGDWLYIFSDGYSDQFGGENGKKFKSSTLKKLFIEMMGKDGKTQKERLKSEFDLWKGELEQVDDVCVIGIKM